MNKRLKKKTAKAKFCKSPVWHGAKIKTKDVRVQTYRGRFCDYGLAERERPKLKACPICGKTRRTKFFKSCPDCAWVFEYREALDGLLERIEERLRVQGAGALGLGTWRNAVSLKNRKPYPSDSGVRCML